MMSQVIVTSITGGINSRMIPWITALVIVYWLLTQFAVSVGLG